MAKPRKSLQQDHLLMQAANAGDWNTAEKRVRQFLRKNGRDVEALLMLAEVKMQKSEATEALAAFEKALSIDQSMTMAHFGCGKALMMLDRTDEALVSFERYLESEPGDPDALLNAGMCHLSARDPDMAIQRLNQAADTGAMTADQSYFIKMALIEAYRDSGDHNAMRTLAREIYKAFPSSRAALWKLLSYGQKGRLPLRADAL